MMAVKRKPTPKPSASDDASAKHVLYARLDADLMRALRERNIREQSAEGPHVSLTQTVIRLLRQSLVEAD